MRQMSMEGVHQAAITLPSAPPTPETSAPTQSVSPIVYSISQHYHHSSHLAPSATPSELRRGLTGPEIRSDLPAESILMQHNIDPWTLFPSQLTLFKQADQEQQSRLITLWQISPPGHGNQAAPHGNGTTGQEGVYSAIGNGDDSMDSMDSMEEDGPVDQHAEPYVISGYESLAQRDYDISAGGVGTQLPQSAPSPRIEPSTGSEYKLANDPAYQVKDWWHGSDEQYPVEHQYGAFQQMNRYRGCGLAHARGHWMEDEQML